jgi:glutaminase
MINAGAITAASLVAGATRSERFGRLLDTYSRCAGRPLAVDGDVFRSERESGHRNRAIGHMLRTFGILREHPDRTLDLYFRQCAVSVDCRDVSLMAATLANGGRHPQTGERAFGEDGVQRILSVMTTCGMYDGSGAWVDQVGLPAKSGVSGGIFAVLPGQLGLCVYSPRLDERGNSVRGVAACRALAAELELHSLRVPRSSRSAIRASYDVAGVPSRRQRPEAHGRLLRQAGRRALVFELQGDLLFAGVERVVRAVVDRSEALDLVVLDLRPVHRLGASAGRTLGELRAQLAQRGKELLVVDAGEHADAVGDLRVFADLDAASEWCEEHLLAAQGAHLDGKGEVALADHALCRGCDAAELALLEELLARREIPAGRRIVRAGEPAEEVFLLVRGEVSVSLEAADGGRRRLATLPAGSTFDELAVLGRSVRTADVHAERAVTVRVLHAADFERLIDAAPRLNARLLRTMLAGAHATVERMSREVVSLGRGR